MVSIIYIVFGVNEIVGKNPAFESLSLNSLHFIRLCIAV